MEKEREEEENTRKKTKRKERIKQIKTYTAQTLLISHVHDISFLSAYAATLVVLRLALLRGPSRPSLSAGGALQPFVFAFATPLPLTPLGTFATPFALLLPLPFPLACNACPFFVLCTGTSSLSLLPMQLLLPVSWWIPCKASRSFSIAAAARSREAA